MEHVCPGLASDEPYSSIQRIRNLKNLHSVDRTVIVNFLHEAILSLFESEKIGVEAMYPMLDQARAPHPLALSAKPYNPGSLRPIP